MTYNYLQRKSPWMNWATCHFLQFAADAHALPLEHLKEMMTSYPLVVHGDNGVESKMAAVTKHFLFQLCDAQIQVEPLYYYETPEADDTAPYLRLDLNLLFLLLQNRSDVKTMHRQRGSVFEPVPSGGYAALTVYPVFEPVPCAAPIGYPLMTDLARREVARSIDCAGEAGCCTWAWA